jgi:hypothetical protein
MIPGIGKRFFLGSTNLPIQRVSRLKRPGREAGNSSASAKVENMEIYLHSPGGVVLN